MSTIDQANTNANDKATVALDEKAVEELSSKLRGPLLRPGDADYKQASMIYNRMIDKHPALIVQCEDVADIIAAVNFARDQHLTLAIRGGGHNPSGLSTCDDGLVVDLSRMRRVHVDPIARTAWVDGGCLWKDVNHATDVFGLAAPSGVISTTGVGGLTLGGGVGALARPYGLLVDSLLAVDMVLADGSFVRASREAYPDLFWAIRGGGGNFGVVASFLFKLYPVSKVLGGLMIWRFEDAKKVMQFWRDFMFKEAPDEMNGWFGFMMVPPAPEFPEELHLQKVCAIAWCWIGAPEQGEKLFSTIRDRVPPVLDLIQRMPFPVMQSMFDALYPPGLYSYWKSDFFDSLSDEAIDVNIKHSAQLPSPLSVMHLYPINGAVHRIGKKETAFNYRDAQYVSVILGADANRKSSESLIQWVRAYARDMHPFSMGGGYVNLQMAEGVNQVKASYGENYEELVKIKQKYDPQNFFHVNHNIAPNVS
ncbi:hypothetical protein BZG36_04875 [Bifiguratus adelaidae]|uniref:FAD-binding PCMH-type domain-containing protein n=1 Tax=Bifiguratus adelaidae TaxID=1938954 RepID=A0A261XVL5_9FUNG|nr:hypothetical protein BZG36_04875 [Bifiguratus adelaidae]